VGRALARAISMEKYAMEREERSGVGALTTGTGTVGVDMLGEDLFFIVASRTFFGPGGRSKDYPFDVDLL
jgi:hypothetical protein